MASQALGIYRRFVHGWHRIRRRTSDIRFTTILSPARRRHAEFALERPIERRFRIVADLFRYRGE